MIEFQNEKMIKEWITNLENHITMLKAHIICEKRQCGIVSKTTNGFLYKDEANADIVAIKDCAEMVGKYLA